MPYCQRLLYISCIWVCTYIFFYILGFCVETQDFASYAPETPDIKETQDIASLRLNAAGILNGLCLHFDNKVVQNEIIGRAKKCYCIILNCYVVILK